MPTSLTWQKSTFSGEAANCVNLAAAPDHTIRLRESDDPAVILAAPPTAMVGFLAAIKAGRLPASLPAR